MVIAGELIPVNRGRRIVVADGQIQIAVPVEIGYRNAPAVGNFVASSGPRDIRELPVSQVFKENVPFASVPGIVGDEVPAEELAGLVVVEMRDRAAEKGQSQVVGLLPGDPSVGSVDIQIGVIVRIEERNGPSPTGPVRLTVPALGESAIAVVLK